MFDDQYMQGTFAVDLDSDTRIGVWRTPFDGSPAPEGSGILVVNNNKFQLYDKRLVDALVVALGG